MRNIQASKRVPSWKVAALASAALTGHLHQIVGQLARTAERNGEPPEVRQEGHKLVFDASSRHRVPSPLGQPPHFSSRILSGINRVHARFPTGPV